MTPSRAFEHLAGLSDHVSENIEMIDAVGWWHNLEDECHVTKKRAQYAAAQWLANHVILR